MRLASLDGKHGPKYGSLQVLPSATMFVGLGEGPSPYYIQHDRAFASAE